MLDVRNKITQFIFVGLGAGLTGASQTMDNAFIGVSLFVVGIGLLVTSAYLIRKNKATKTEL